MNSKAPEENKELATMGKGNKLLPKERRVAGEEVVIQKGRTEIRTGICSEHMQFPRILPGQIQDDGT